MRLSSTENFTNDNLAMNTTFPPPVKMIDTKAPMNIFVVASLVSLFVCVMNPLTIVTILRTPSLRRCHSNIFLVNLAVVDLIFMLLVLTFVANSWLGSYNWVMFILSIVYMGNACSGTMLFCFAIAVDRFLFIHKALTYSTIVTHGRVIKVVASIWMASCLIGLMPLMDGKILMSHDHHESSVSVVIQCMTIITLYFVTAIISICLYTKLFFVIRDHNKVLQSHAMAHSRSHNCSNHACTIKTRLGECRFRHHNHSSFTWSTSDCPAKDALVEGTSLIFNHRVRCSATKSQTSGIPTATSLLSTNEDDVSVSCVDQSTGQTSRIYSQQAIARVGSSSTDPQDQVLVEARQVKTAKEPQKKRHKGQCQHLRDLRTIKALMMMFAIYFICWAPAMAMKIWHNIFHMPDIAVNISIFQLIVDFLARLRSVVCHCFLSDRLTYSTSYRRGQNRYRFWLYVTLLTRVQGIMEKDVKPLGQISEQWMNAAWICVMSNSVWNFLVYPLRKKDFRDSMLKMVRRCLGLHPDHRRSRSLPTETTSDSVQNSLKKSSSYASRMS